MASAIEQINMMTQEIRRIVSGGTMRTFEEVIEHDFQTKMDDKDVQIKKLKAAKVEASRKFAQAKTDSEKQFFQAEFLKVCTQLDELIKSQPAKSPDEEAAENSADELAKLRAMASKFEFDVRLRAHLGREIPERITDALEEVLLKIKSIIPPDTETRLSHFMARETGFRWKARDGRVTDVAEIDGEHLINIYNFIPRSKMDETAKEKWTAITEIEMEYRRVNNFDIERTGEFLDLIDRQMQAKPAAKIEFDTFDDDIPF